MNRTPFVFTVTLNRASEQAETVAYRTVDGSAEAGSDYDATSGTLTFAAGETSKTVTVPVVRDRTTEPNEAFTLELTDDGTSPASADGSGLGTIVNDDPKPRISAGDAGVAEGNAFTRPLRFPVRLDRASSTPVTVKFTSVDGSAKAPSDYTAVSGTVTFPACSTQQFATVMIKGDRLKESNETLTLNVFAPTGATIADPNGSGVVRNDD